MVSKPNQSRWRASRSRADNRETCCLYGAISGEKLDNRCRSGTPPMSIQPGKPEILETAQKTLAPATSMSLTLPGLFCKNQEPPWQQFCFYFVCSSVRATDIPLWSSDSSRQSSHCFCKVVFWRDKPCEMVLMMSQGLNILVPMRHQTVSHTRDENWKSTPDCIVTIMNALSVSTPIHLLLEVTSQL